MILPLFSCTSPLINNGWRGSSENFSASPSPPFWNFHVNNLKDMNMMRFRLVSLITVWNFALVGSRPADLFSSDEPIGNNVDLFSSEGLDPGTSIFNSNDLAFNSELTPSNLDTGTSMANSNGLFPTEDVSLSAIPSLQSASGCQIDDSLTQIDGDGLLLQARDNALCPSPKTKETFDSLGNLFQDPEGWLNQIVRLKKAPVGQANPPGKDNENLDFSAFLNNRATPFFFREDEEICPAKVFGLSNTPVCFNAARGTMVLDPGSWVTLRPVTACMCPFSIQLYDRISLSDSKLIWRNRYFEHSSMLCERRKVVLPRDYSRGEVCII